jgi:hypothetical protein
MSRNSGSISLTHWSAWGHERRFCHVHDASGLPPTPERLRQRSEPTLRANALNRFAIVARLRLVLSDISMEEIVGSGGSALS